MRILKSIWILIIFSSAIVSCKDDDPSINCDDQAVISDSEISTATRDQLVINSLEINGDCLLISFSASGCDGDSWVVRLIGSELVLESLPPQRGMLLSLDNDELCEAVITREVSFDITPTRVGSTSIWLNFNNDEDRILYEYN